MINLIKTQRGRFRLLALIEGISFLLILFVTMPLKYQFGMPTPNKVVGMIHGLLFIGYIMAVIRIKVEENWTGKFTGVALLAGVIPGGTFYIDWKLRKEVETEEQ